jgi:hypothetical protein
MKTTQPCGQLSIVLIVDYINLGNIRTERVIYGGGICLILYIFQVDMRDVVD